MKKQQETQEELKGSAESGDNSSLQAITNTHVIHF